MVEVRLFDSLFPIMRVGGEIKGWESGRVYQTFQNLSVKAARAG